MLPRAAKGIHQRINVTVIVPNNVRQDKMVLKRAVEDAFPETGRMEDIKNEGRASPEFPVDFGGGGKLNAVFLNENRTHGRWCMPRGRKSGSPIFFSPGTLERTLGTRPVTRIAEPSYPLFLVEHLPRVGVNIGNVAGLLVPPHQVPDRRLEPVGIPKLKG
jgi:hypothetical protein